VTSKTNGRRILVLDDHYGVESDEFYSRVEFEKDYASVPHTFVFSDAWDRERNTYTVEAALRAIDAEAPNGLLLDVVFDQKAPAGQLGLLILKELSLRRPNLPVVVMTVLDKAEVWTDCARLGAVDYLPKPLDARLLSQTLNRYVGVEPEYWLIGQDRAFLDVVNLAAMAAEGGVTPVMITGETGTGKELIARYVHRHGRRSAKPFDAIFLPTIPAETQASELFGHRKGAFTGADRDQPGRFLSADGGVVFLDEIGDIDDGTQLRLLRVADLGEVSRLGDGRTARVDVQIVTATNADLAHKIKNREFRHDLWARLNGVSVRLPSLALRREDIPMLVVHLLRCQALKRGRPMPTVPESVMSKLIAFLWAGNVRGLRAYAQRVFDLAGAGEPVAATFLAALQADESLSGPTVHAEETAVRPSALTGAARPRDAADPLAAIQCLRLEELSVLSEALDRTRDPVTHAANRAKAAALLKGKEKCSTNEFDRWVNNVWGELNPESRVIAAQRFPELAAVAQDSNGEDGAPSPADKTRKGAS
jgi:two-component system, NtrC family, nitrogen regulation response regulator GlnG